MDGPRRSIYKGTWEAAASNWQNQMVDSLCSELNLEFLDLTETFLRDYTLHGKTFEFREDSHWNTYGHAVVAKAIFDYVNGE